MKKSVCSGLGLVCALLLGGCDREGRPVEQIGLDKLAKGVSTEGEVRMVMGPPESQWEEENGNHVLQYSQSPMGARTWMFLIGSDGKLKDYQQMLTEQNFAQIQPGMSKEAVKRLLGKPRTVVQFNLKNEEVWDWRYLQSPTHSRLFNVHFDLDSELVTRTSFSDEKEHG